jgi:phospholipid transport system substrate-binding protein
LTLPATKTLSRPRVNRWLRALPGLALAAALALSAPVPATAGETPSQTVQSVNDAVLHVMRNAEALGQSGRQEYLEPVLTQAFDLPAMTRLAVGRHWDKLSEAERGALIQRFTDLSVASFAARFDGYSGQSWRIDGTTEAPRGGVIVENRLIMPDGEPVAIDYLTHRRGEDDWAILDVYLDGGISEIALRRSEFASVIKSSGVEALIDQIAKKVDRLENGTVN